MTHHFATLSAVLRVGVSELFLSAAHPWATNQQAVSKPRGTTNNCRKLFLGFHPVEVVVEYIFEDGTEFEDSVHSRGVNDRDRRREVLVMPVGCSGGRELGSGELAEAVRLIFDCHRKHLGVFDEIALSSGGWRSDGACRCVVGELGAVVEQVEVLDHVLDDLRFVAKAIGVGAIFYRFQLNDSSFSFLVTVSRSIAETWARYRTLNAPFFSAVLKYVD